ncbi:hypothetical protein K4F52_010328 [Lecanicillium sp. MT-2017a]|nr:hypothetical protein K4F52_010328 [Lecanicillium sp. MT-2017a]
MVACDTVQSIYAFYASTFGQDSTSISSSSETSSTTSYITTTTTIPPVPPQPGHSPPVGAIVGGVVGGVALIVVAGAVFFLYRYKKERPSRNQDVGDMEPTYDPRASVAKSSMYSPLAVASPIQQNAYPMNQPASPPPLYGMSPPLQQQAMSGPPNHVAELSTIKSRGPVQELQ